MDHEINAIKQILKMAFPRRLMSSSIVIDSAMCSIKGREITDALHNKAWEDVDFAKISNITGALYLLSLDAYHFYLPCWLVNAIGPLGSDTTLDDLMLCLVIPYVDKYREWPLPSKWLIDINESELSKMRCANEVFVELEKIAICQSLRMIDYDNKIDNGVSDIQISIREFWGK